jgi:hypothetical protein
LPEKIAQGLIVKLLTYGCCPGKAAATGQSDPAHAFHFLQCPVPPPVAVLSGPAGEMPCVFGPIPLPVVLKPSPKPGQTNVTIDRMCMPYCLMRRPIPGAIIRTAAATTPMPPAPVKEEIHVSATGKRVHVLTPCLDAHCDRMTSVSPAGRVMLEGNVVLKCKLAGCPARVAADHVIVGLTDGYFEIDPAPSLIPTAVFSEPVLRGLQNAFWVAPPMIQEKPGCNKVKPACPAVAPAGYGLDELRRWGVQCPF